MVKACQLKTKSSVRIPGTISLEGWEIKCFRERVISKTLDQKSKRSHYRPWHIIIIALSSISQRNENLPSTFTISQAEYRYFLLGKLSQEDYLKLWLQGWLSQHSYIFSQKGKQKLYIQFPPNGEKSKS